MPLKPIEPGTDKPKKERSMTGGERRDHAAAARDSRAWREAVDKGYNNRNVRRGK